MLGHSKNSFGKMTIGQSNVAVENVTVKENSGGTIKHVSKVNGGSSGAGFTNFEYQKIDIYSYTALINAYANYQNSPWQKSGSDGIELQFYLD